MTRAEEEEQLRRLCRAWGVTGVCGVLSAVAAFCEGEAAKAPEGSLELQRWARLSGALREASKGLRDERRELAR